MTLIEIDGRSPESEQLAAAALDSYGHFTAMQVRNHRVRGLALQLARLTGAHRELFDTELDGDVVRGHIRHALSAGAGDGSVRVNLRQPGDRPSVMVTVRPPGGMTPGRWRLRSVPYQRPVAHIKHLADFGQGYYQRLARREGFDEALLTGPGGLISEGSITNIGFFDGPMVIWPDAPVLAGITTAYARAQWDLI
jgi:branched-subunit amino acid aminotransferase/4-amino-4-deoxychorismate lyase